MMQRELELVTEIAVADGVDAVWTAACRYFACMGFARVTYGLTRFRTERSIGDLDDILFLTTHSPDYTAFYFRDRFFARTPVFRWLATHSGATTWLWVAEKLAAGELTPEEADAVRRNAERGVVAGVSIAFDDPRDRTRGALGLTADAGLTHDDVEAIWQREQTAIQSVAHVMHLKLLSLPARSSRRKLTERQSQVLVWTADGKTAQDIAVILGLSAAAVEKHLRLAREALAVETTAQAVAKAVLLNLLPKDPARVGNPRLS
jgi:LuxR family transcriptional regulator